MDSSAAKTKILIANGSKVFCEGLCCLLNQRKPDCLCFTKFDKAPPPPDVIIVESTQSLEVLKNKYPEAKTVLMDTGLAEKEILYILLTYKVDGVVPSDTSIDLFLKALEVVLSGQIWIENKYLKALLQRSDSINVGGCIKSLSAQDRNIVQLVAKGQKNREIAEQLCLSEHTIKAHISRIFRKLNLQRRGQLIALALENNLHLAPKTES